MKNVLLSFSSFNFCTFALHKSYPNKQNNADHSNLDGCQVITQKQDNSSNALNFKELYSLYKSTERHWKISTKQEMIITSL